MNTRLLRFGLPALLVAGILTVTVGSGSLLADGDDDLQATPFVFVGAADDCGAGYPAGSRIVTARWLGGMGLPDNGGPNVALDPSDNPSKRNPHRGLLLSKNGTTADCSAAGAEISGVRRMLVTATFELGFDYRNGGHCGAGATRFNVVVRPPGEDDDTNDTFHFVGGCSNDNESTGAPQDPAQWTRVRFQTSDPGESFPVIPLGHRIQSITLIHDEGTDTANNDTEGVGLAVLDNIFINGTVIPSGRGIPPDDSDY